MLLFDKIFQDQISCKQVNSSKSANQISKSEFEMRIEFENREKKEKKI
jgi:hypothetical protein